MEVNDFKELLVNTIKANPNILAIGQTGDLKAKLVKGKSDIDMFVLCSQIPSLSERVSMYESLQPYYQRLDYEVCKGGIWGVGDIFIVEEIDVMPMYFTVEEMDNYVTEVLEGKHLNKQGRFYPIGRLASIETINVLYETNDTFTTIINKVKTKPDELFEKWYKSEIAKVIDEEDLSRASLRKEVLFFHQVVEEFLDHFLQALYAKNKTYFPSRKRTEQAISSFKKKPDNCYERLEEIVRLASNSETIEASIEMIRQITNQMKEL